MYANGLAVRIVAVQVMPDRNKAKAEIAVYLGKFDEAEAIYRGIDRKDLALQVHTYIPHCTS